MGFYSSSSSSGLARPPDGDTRLTSHLKFNITQATIIPAIAPVNRVLRARLRSGSTGAGTEGLPATRYSVASTSDPVNRASSSVKTQSREAKVLTLSWARFNSVSAKILSYPSCFGF